MTKYFSTVVVIALAVMSAGLMMAQQTAPMPVPGTGSGTAVNQQQPAPCPLGADRILFVEGGGEVKELCYSEAAYPTPSVRALFYEQGVQQIVPLGPSSFYAYTNGGKVVLATYNGNGYDIYRWRVYGGGFIVAVNAEDTQNTVDVRLPYDREQYRFWLWPGSPAGYPTKVDMPLDDKKLGCGPTVKLDSTQQEFCLDLLGWFVWQPHMMPGVGNVYSHPFTRAIFQQGMPVGITTHGGVLYTTFGTRYEYPDNPQPGLVNPTSVTLGRLAATKFGFDGSSNTETVVDGLDIVSDLYQPRLATSNQGVYFVHQVREGQEIKYRLSFHSYRGKKNEMMALYTSNGFMTGLAVAPPMFPAPPLPPSIPQTRP